MSSGLLSMLGGKPSSLRSGRRRSRLAKLAKLYRIDSHCHSLPITLVQA